MTAVQVAWTATARRDLERPCRILYRIEGQRVLVLAVLDGRRSLTALLLERLVRS